MTDAIRTPDVLLEGLPDFPWEPHYRQVDGLRLAHVDEGDGAPVVFWHGEPTWSFLWRKVAPPVLRGRPPRDPARPAGLRPLGQADRRGLVLLRPPRGRGRALLEDLDLRGATFVMHDWGGPIGLRVAVELAERVDRLVVMDTGVFTGEQPMSDNWHRFREFVERAEELPVCLLVRRACATDPGDEVAAAYDAPFPSEASKAGARAFPAILPLSPTTPARRRAGARWPRCARTRGRRSCCGPTQDPVLPVRAGEALASAIGWPAPRVIDGAGHFLQEDQGALVGSLIADWLGSAWLGGACAPGRAGPRPPCRRSGALAATRDS